MPLPPLVQKATDHLKKRLLDTWNLLRALFRGGIPERFWIGVFCLGIALGIGLKMPARTTLTIGFDDYRLRSATELYDINARQKAALESGGSLTASERETVYPACSVYE